MARTVQAPAIVLEEVRNYYWTVERDPSGGVVITEHYNVTTAGGSYSEPQQHIQLTLTAPQTAALQGIFTARRAAAVQRELGV